jgi:hypothetical protein
MQKLEGFRNKIKLTKGSNVLRLNRPYYVKAAVNAFQPLKFMKSILSKFVVVFKGEEGVSVGGGGSDETFSPICSIDSRQFLLIIVITFWKPWKARLVQV